jgi:hypothetical protein
MLRLRICTVLWITHMWETEAARMCEASDVCLCRAEAARLHIGEAVHMRRS